MGRPTDQFFCRVVREVRSNDVFSRSVVENFLHPGPAEFCLLLTTFISNKEMLHLAPHWDITLVSVETWGVPLYFQGRLLHGHWHHLFLTLRQFLVELEATCLVTLVSVCTCVCEKVQTFFILFFLLNLKNSKTKWFWIPHPSPQVPKTTGLLCRFGVVHFRMESHSSYLLTVHLHIVSSILINLSLHLPT